MGKKNIIKDFEDRLTSIHLRYIYYRTTCNILYNEDKTEYILELETVDDHQVNIQLEVDNTLNNADLKKDIEKDLEQVEDIIRNYSIECKERVEGYDDLEKEEIIKEIAQNLNNYYKKIGGLK